MYKTALREHSFPLFNRRVTGPCRAKLSATHQHLEIKTPQPTLQRLRFEYGGRIILEGQHWRVCQLRGGSREKSYSQPEHFLKSSDLSTVIAKNEISLRRQLWNCSSDISTIWLSHLVLLTIEVFMKAFTLQHFKMKQGCALWSAIRAQMISKLWTNFIMFRNKHTIHRRSMQASFCQCSKSFEGAEKANLTVLMLQPRNLIYQFAGRQDGRKQANLPRVQRTANPSLAPSASWEVIIPKKECHAVLRCSRIKTRETASLQVIMRELETSFN